MYKRQLLVIYLVWGFTALFAFWPALVKGIRSLASSEEQGKAFGFMEAGRGVTNAAHLAVALAIITFVSKSTGSSDMNATGLKAGIIFYSVVVILLGILVLLFFKDPETNDKSERFNFKQVFTVLRLPQVWILCLILCCTYVMNLSLIHISKAAIVPTNRERLVEWLRSLREGDVHDKKYQAGLFDTFLVAAYLYDDNRVKIVFSFAGDKNTIEIPLEDVIDSIDDEASCVRLSSTLSHQKERHDFRRVFLFVFNPLMWVPVIMTHPGYHVLGQKL